MRVWGTMRLVALLVIALLVGLVVLAGCGAEDEAGSGLKTTEDTTSATRNSTPTSEVRDYDATVTVTKAIDGDTVEISPGVDGIEELRLLGVDAPEMEDPDCGKQPYGQEARKFAASELRGQEVGLEFDEERTDRDGRLLAYAYQDGGMFNEALLEGGYAQVATFPPNTRYVERFEEAQEEARAAGRGIWGLPKEQRAQLTDHGNGIGGAECDQKGKAAKQKGKAAKQKAPQQKSRATSPAPIPSPSVSPTPSPSPAPTPSPSPSPTPSPPPGPSPPPPGPSPSPAPSPAPASSPSPSPAPGPSPEPSPLPPPPPQSEPEQAPASDGADFD
jgi:micrococcal nuclease